MRTVPLLTTMAILGAGAALARDPVPPQVPEHAAATAGEPAAAGPDDGAATFLIRALPDLGGGPDAADGQRAVLLEELRLAREQETLQVAELTASLAQAASHEERLALQRRIGAVKSAAALQGLTIQLEHARRAGSEPLVQKLEAAIEQFTAPRAAPDKASRTVTEREARPAGGASR